MNHIVVALLIFISTCSFADEYPSCNIHKSADISFQKSESMDTLEVSVIGVSCYDAELRIRVLSIEGQVLYEYSSEYKIHTTVKWEDPDLNIVVENHVKAILDTAITPSSLLPIEFACEIPAPECVSYERNTVPLDIYMLIRESGVPMLNHPTYYEGWASFIYDQKTNKTIKIYEGGV